MPAKRAISKQIKKRILITSTVFSSVFPIIGAFLDTKTYILLSICSKLFRDKIRSLPLYLNYEFSENKIIEFLAHNQNPNIKSIHLKSSIPKSWEDIMNKITNIATLESLTLSTSHFSYAIRFNNFKIFSKLKKLNLGSRSALPDLFQCPKLEVLEIDYKHKNHVLDNLKLRISSVVLIGMFRLII